MKKNNLFKIISLLLVASMVLSICLFAGCNQNADDEKGKHDSSSHDEDYLQTEDDEPEEEPDPDYFIGVIADPQVTPTESIDNPFLNTRYLTEFHDNLESRENFDVNYLSEAIYRSAIYRNAESGVDCLFIIGDLTDTRDARAITTIREGCEKLNDAGISVYTMFGINDSPVTTNIRAHNYVKLSKRDRVAQWDVTNFFDEFSGYMAAEPISVHEESYSYVADLPGDRFRLISFNSAMSFEGVYFAHSISQDMPGSNTVTDDQIEWLESELIKAQEDGKEVVMMTYFPFHTDINYQCGPLYSEVFLTVDRADEIKPLLTKYGVKVVYNGHVQLEGEASYSDENGTVQFVSSTSLATYPLPLKISKHVGDKFVSEIGHLTSINEEYLPSYLSEEQVTLATTDAVEYAKQFAKAAYTQKWRKESQLGDATKSVAVEILTKLHLYDGSQKAKDIVAKIEDWFTGVNNMPLYGTDAESVESICLSYGKQIPKIQGVTTVLDFMEEMAALTFCGDMDILPGSANSLMFRYIIYAGIKKVGDSNIFADLHELNDVIYVCNMNAVIKEMFATDTIGLATGGFVFSLITMFVPLVRDKGLPNFTINTSSPENLVGLLSILLPTILPALGNNYDSEKGTIWMVPYKEVFDLNNGTVNIGYLVDSFGPSLVCKNTQGRK